VIVVGLAGWPIRMLVGVEIGIQGFIRPLHWFVAIARGAIIVADARWPNQSEYAVKIANWDTDIEQKTENMQDAKA